MVNDDLSNIENVILIALSFTTGYLFFRTVETFIHYKFPQKAGIATGFAFVLVAGILILCAHFFKKDVVSGGH